MTTSTPIAASTRTRPPIPGYVLHSAWILPVLVLGQFALLGAIPVALIITGTAARVEDRALRWLAALLTVSYITPLVSWAVNPDRAQSLTKDMNPLFAALIVAFSIAFWARAVRMRTR